MSKSSTEKVSKKIKIMQAALEGAQARINDYNPNDEVFEGLEWAFRELKREIEHQRGAK